MRGYGTSPSKHVDALAGNFTHGVSNALWIRFHVVVLVPQHLEVPLAHPAVARGVVFLAFFVRGSVQLDYKPGGVAVEIRDERAAWMLTTKRQDLIAPLAQHDPELAFGTGQILAELFRAQIGFVGRDEVVALETG